MSYKINVECPQSCWMFAQPSVSWFFTLLLLSDSNKQTTEKAMATHSSTLAWKIPWMEEPRRLCSMGSLRVGHDWATSLSLFYFPALEKEMATHSSVLAWRIPRTGEPGGLPSLGSHRVGHDWSDLAAAAISKQKGISSLSGFSFIQYVSPGW